jgi:HEAT repeat protein
MAIGISSRSGQPVPSLVRPVLRAAVLLVPAALLLIASLRVPGQANTMLWLGTAFQFLCCWLSFLSAQGRRQPLGPSVITLYTIALGWLWLGNPGAGDWYFHLARSVLLVVPLIAFGGQMLNDSGATALRRADVLARRLGSRKDWPADLDACRTLPEVKALREALHIDASPALALLHAPGPEVRVAALAALEFRQNWKAGQAEMVLRVAQQAEEPAVRAAAVTALANLDDRELIETLASFLRDPSPVVRQAATEALLWDSERRWSWIRHAVRHSLADPTFKDDGPLRFEGQPFTPAAVADLTAWAAEKGVLSIRAALTLGVHYSRAIAEQPDEDLLPDLRRQLADPHTPPPLRMELVRLLQHNNELDHALVRKLLDPTNPAPLRLVAIEELLGEGENPEAVAALHDLARMPNREIALATADVVQRRLGVDLGLALGEPLPPIHSRPAAEVTRRVMAWAAQNEVPDTTADPADRAASGSTQRLLP